MQGTQTAAQISRAAKAVTNRVHVQDACQVGGSSLKILDLTLTSPHMLNIVGVPRLAHLSYSRKMYCFVVSFAAGHCPGGIACKQSRRVSQCIGSHACLQALLLSMKSPTPGEVFNLADDDSASRAAVLQYASQLLSQSSEAQSSEQAGSAAAQEALQTVQEQQVRGEKLVCNRKAKKLLGWQPQYPSYREGLQQCLQMRYG